MDILKLLQRAYRAYRRKKNWQRVVQAMAMAVVFCTTYALILPAITMESGTICGLTEHTHTDACYAVVTEPETHTHTDDCYEKTLICGLEESEGHDHTDSCNGIVETLICTADHEEHVATCYSYETGLVCGLEESEGHSHSDGCWESKLSCGLEEAVEETTEATEETEESTGATVPEETVQRELVCGLEEHTHDESCYPVTEPQTTEDTTALSDADPEADLETQEDWEASLSTVNLTGDWSADILAIAASQLGYTESQSNYITDENGQTFYYTRYGQWYGAPYGDWSAMFVSFCLRYAQIEGIPADQDCQNLLNVLNAAEIYREAAQYVPVPGDLIFLDTDADGYSDSMGILEEIVAATEEAPEMVRFFAGDWEGRVERVTMEAQDVSVLGYAVLPTEPDDTQEHTFVGEDGLSAQVALDALTTAVPEDAVLTIEAVTEADEQYAAMTEQVDALVDKEILDITMLDISFYDAEGEYISVGESASVRVSFEGDAFGGNAVKVFHFTEDGPTELSGVAYYYEYETAEDGTEAVQTVLTFQTEGFSVFSVVEIPASTSFEDVSTTADLTNLSGEYYIVRNQDNVLYAVMATAATKGNYSGLGKSSGTTAVGLESCTAWTFHQVSENTYRISAVVNGKTYYITASYADTQVANYELVEYATATEIEQSATIFTVGKNGNYINISCKITNGDTTYTYYINPHGGAVAATAFLGWHEKWGGSEMSLYIKKDTGNAVTTLAGQSYALITPKEIKTGFYKALTTKTIDNVNGVSGLGAANVSTTEINGTPYYKDAVDEGDDIDAAIWLFEEFDSANGKYYISTTVNGTKKYLTLLETNYLEDNASVPGSGSLTLVETNKPQAITVTRNDNGTVSLSAQTTDNGTGYINLNAGSYDFWTYKENADSCQFQLCKPENPEVSSFKIKCEGGTITVHLQDTNGQPLSVYKEDITLTENNKYTYFANIAPTIDGYVYEYATYGSIEVVSVAPIIDNNTEKYRFYPSSHTEGSTTDGQWYTPDGNKDIYLTYRTTEPILYYNLNTEHSTWIDDSDPYISQKYQKITTEGTKLFQVQGGTVAGTYVANTFRENVDVRTWYQDRNNNLKAADKLTADNYLAPDREYEFLGWEASNTNGVTCLFPEDAEAYLDAEGNICVKDTTGAIQTLKRGTVLTGKWKVRSDIVLFFVNFGSTMLEGENNKKIGKNLGAESFTDVVAFGHVYNPSNEDAIDTGYIRIEDHQTIENELRPNHDPSDSNMHIVVDAIAEFKPGANDSQVVQQFTPVDIGCNETQLEQYASLYIQKNPDESKHITLGNAELEQSTITPDNYKLYWYMQRDVGSDGWHIDGVLVAKTVPIEIYKTFSGLESHSVGTSNDATTLIGQMTFPMYLLHTETSTDGTKTTLRDYYTTLDADVPVGGVFDINGWQSSTGNIYKWTLHSVLGQFYAIEETDYALTSNISSDKNDYDCSTLISVHYTDGEIIYEYGTTATYKDLTEGAGIEAENIQVEDLFDNGPDDRAIIGGQVKSIIFANFYTPKGTGMFSISKVADDAGQDRLAGAEFTLTPENGTAITARTNENGAAHFSDLQPGTYTLEETKAPTGYQKLDTTWTVVVQSDGNGIVTVTIEGSEVYNSTDGITDVYLIKNTPEVSTVTVNKYFEGILDKEIRPVDQNVASLYDTDNEWSDDYYIEVKDGEEVKYILTLYENDQYADEKVIAGTPITGDMGYTWTIDLPVGTGQSSKDYTFVERNFHHQNYLDTVVAATYKETTETTAATLDVNVTGAGATDTATFTVTKSGAAGTVNITNSYTNEFILRIHKVDATNNNAAMSGVKFNIYGDYEFAVKPQDGIDPTISYTASDGSTKTAYYIGTTTQTNASGLTEYADMHLSAGTNQFLYVISEANTPAGYVKLDEPIVKVVTVDGTDPNYSNGVYNLTVENVRNHLATVTVTATKTWQVPSDMTKPEIELTLYKKVADGTVTSVSSVKLDGTTGKTETLSGGVTVTIDGWQVVWSGLAYADRTTDAEDKVTRNEYFVVETLMDGYNTTYSTTVSELTVDGETVFAAIADGYELRRSVTITNTSGYALPETGGTGTRWMAPLGLMLILAATALYWLGIEKKKQGGVDSS